MQPPATPIGVKANSDRSDRLSRLAGDAAIH
jgi:hypothetical protein